jgi:aryl-alcohol dehydrogenase-like predicted oxidoreductase
LKELVEISFESGLHKVTPRTPGLTGQPIELRFDFGFELYFHVCSVGGGRTAVKKRWNIVSSRLSGEDRGLKVPELCFGWGRLARHVCNEFFKAWGASDVDEARKIVDICMEAGLNFFDTADIYSYGASERCWGKAIKHLKREDVLISTKATFRFGKGPNDVGSSRYHLTQALEGSLKRLGTDYVDVYHLHAFDATTPVEETLNTLDKFVREGKVRYIACSNFSGWHLMKSLSVSERYGWARYVGHQVYYSLVGRDYEWELMPLALDQGVGALVWSPLGWGRLTGKIRRGTADSGGAG